MSTIIDNPESMTLVCDPVPHMVVDHWTSPELVRAAEAEWPADDWPFWHRYGNGKLATKDPLRYPPACAELIRRLLCVPVCDLLEIDGAFGDWNCHGAGLHAIPPGADLGVHLDSDHHPATGWVRAANAVLYVNSDWDEHSGGEFELWNDAATERVRRIEPRFNRLVLFAPSDVSWHSVARVRGDQSRKSLTAFFWRHGRSQCHRGQAHFRET